MSEHEREYEALTALLEDREQRIRELEDAARPYLEKAAPDENLWDAEDYRNYRRLAAALTVDPLARE